MAFRRRNRADDTTGGPLFDPSKVDLVALSPGDEAVELIIVADAGWSGSDSQIRSLQEKIQTYVGFAVDGQLAELHPEAADKPWRIVLHSQGQPPDERTRDVLDRTRAPVQKHGGDLEIRS